MRVLFISSALLTAAMPAAAEGLSIGLPIDCEPGKTCWVQQYPDRDPTTAAKDYACGSQTYDGHQGTDIRIRDTSSSAEVVAAAAGTVKAVRDGVKDRLVRTDADRAAIAKIECGNGVLLSHENGWETQYCHLREGSVSVRPGDSVAMGAPLGLVGYSGMAAFPHVHLTVRKDGKVVDPFRNSSDSSCGGVVQALWNDEALSALTYQRSAILRGGFAPGAIDLPDVEAGNDQTLGTGKPGKDWQAMVSYVWAINLEEGDEIIVSLEGPAGLSASNSVRLDRSKAQYLLFAGKKRPAGGWPSGRYIARVEILNDGKVRLTEEWTTTVD